MKFAKVFFASGLVIFAAVVLFRSSLEAGNLLGNGNDSPTSSPQVLGEPSIVNVSQHDLAFNDSEYRIAWIYANPENTVLFPNLDGSDTSIELKEKNSCAALINAGFYDESGAPIGLMISNRNTISEYEKNSLFDGIFSINEFDTPRITTEIPADPLVYAVQTGPVLKNNGFYHSLSLIRDKKARRVVGAVNGSNELFFIVIYNQNSVFSGPLLEDLPAILEQFEEETGTKIADAVNMDGGSASAFLAGEIKLTEISPIGSFFCVK